MRYIDNECERDDREIMREGESESGKKGEERERVRWRTTEWEMAGEGERVSETHRQNE